MEKAGWYDAGETMPPDGQGRTWVIGFYGSNIWAAWRYYRTTTVAANRARTPPP